MKIKGFLKNLKEPPWLFGVIDPPLKPDFSREIQMAEAFDKGADALFIGGSIGSSQEVLEEMIEQIKQKTSLPVVLFPGNAEMLSPKADAVLFMSLLNSEDCYWITGAPVLGAPLIKKFGLEAIPTAYLVVEPGQTVGFVGRVRVLKKDRPEIACAYALAAEFTGKHLIILESGSGSQESVPAEMVKKVSASVDIPVTVGGGIRDPKTAKELVKNGASGIQIGTVIENNNNPERAVKSFLEAVKG